MRWPSLRVWIILFVIAREIALLVVVRRNSECAIKQNTKDCTMHHWSDDRLTHLVSTCSHAFTLYSPSSTAHRSISLDVVNGMNMTRHFPTPQVLGCSDMVTISVTPDADGRSQCIDAERSFLCLAKRDASRMEAFFSFVLRKQCRILSFFSPLVFFSNQHARGNVRVSCK